MNDINDKMNASHLKRRALVYVRQSSPSQVQNNLESQRRQYALKQRATDLGFAEVQVIDDDLGRSAAGTQARPGFDRLVSAVCAGEVGAVFCLEASRLARNGRDWHHLLDLCALTQTLIIDPDGMYDPRHVNDRLLLGLKGSMSEFELTLLHQRAREAMLQKARRGELQIPLPVGLEWTRDGRIVLHPDLRVQEALRLTFRKFEELGTVRRVRLWYSDNKLQHPFTQRGPHHAERVGWRKPTYCGLYALLKNPMYAGAYAFGRRETRTLIVEGRGQKTQGHQKEVANWTVLLLAHHPGYICWEQYLKNQQMLKDNSHRQRPEERKAGRGGSALLSGLVRCGRCGRKLRVHYYSHKGTYQYQCIGELLEVRKNRCITLGGRWVDQVVSEELLSVLSPHAIEAALLAADQQKEADSQVMRAVELELEQATYQVTLASRRYEEVDPDNRLVALELERRWEQALLRVRETERRLQELQREKQTQGAPTRELLLTLAHDLAAVWKAPGTDPSLKQRIARLLFQEVVCSVDKDRNEYVLVLHWNGGRHSERRVLRTVHGRTLHGVSAAAAELLASKGGHVTDDELAEELNKRGLQTRSGNRWTAERVRSYLFIYKLSYYQVLARTQEVLTVGEVAQRFGLSRDTVKNLIHRRELLAFQRGPRSPFRIPATAVDNESFRSVVADIHAQHRSLLAKGRRAQPQPSSPAVK